MGTNYYCQEKPSCLCCGRPYPLKHIGKSSVGWCFSLHIYPEEGINSFDDWMNKLAGAVILNEYGHILTVEELTKIICDRNSNGNSNERLTSRWLEENNAVKGPNNLARHKIDNYCIGHGEGTYDYIIGEFS